MRITGGTACGLKLTGPKSQQSNSIRPTSDRVREALFSILGSRLLGASVLDLYAGTGSLGIESLSRGATKVVFADHSLKSIELIQKNLHHSLGHLKALILRLKADRASGIHKLQTAATAHLPFDIIFFDPPYGKKLAENTLIMLEKAQLLSDNGCIVVEESSQVKLPDQTNCFSLSMKRKYGETGIWIYEQTSALSPVND